MLSRWRGCGGRTGGVGGRGGELRTDSMWKLTKAYQMIHMLYPEDEESTVHIMATLTDIHEKDKKKFLYAVNSNIRTILEEAIMVNNIHVLKKLLETFPYDLNNIQNNTKAPLHLACLYGKKEIAHLLLEKGATLSTVCKGINISSFISNYTDAKKLAKNSRHKGTPMWFTFVMDHVEILEVLYEFGLLKCYKHETLMTEAINCKAIKCTRFILKNTVRNLQVVLAQNSLQEACKRSWELVQVLLDAGAEFDEAFFTKHPDVLLHYYGEVGYQNSTQKSTCTQFTHLIMLDYNGKTFLKDSIDRALVDKLLERTRNNVQNLKPEEIESFYKDIVDCLKLLVSLNPELPQQIPDTIELALNYITHKYRYGAVNRTEILQMITLIKGLLNVGFDPHGGSCCPLLLVIKLPKLQFSSTADTSQPVIFHQYIHLVRCFLEYGCSPNRVGSYGTPALQRLLDIFFSHAHPNMKIINQTLTKTVDLFCKHGLRPNMEIKHSSPAESNTGTLIHTTYFQLLVNKLSNRNFACQNGFLFTKALLVHLALFAGQQVFFTEEFQHGDFKTAVCSLAVLMVKSSGLNPNLNYNYQPESLSPISKAVSKIFTFLLQKMTYAERYQAYTWFRAEVQTFADVLPSAADIDFNNPRVSKEDIYQLLEEEVSALIEQPMSLQEACALVIRNSIYTQNICDDYGNRCYLKGGSPVPGGRKIAGDTGITLNSSSLNLSVVRESEEADEPCLTERDETLKKLKDSGFHLAKYNLLNVKSEQLPLPSAVKECIALNCQIEDVLVGVWRIFESHQVEF